MKRTKQYRFAIAAVFVVLAAVTAIHASANASSFPLAGAGGLLILAGLAVSSAIQDRRWIVAENMVWAVLAGGATLAVLLPRS